MTTETRTNLEMDGTIQISKDEFHSFLVQIGSSASIFLPKDIFRYLGLSEDSVLLVAIKVADEEIIKEYEYVPRKPRTSLVGRLVNCPVCENEGRLYTYDRICNKGTPRERHDSTAKISHPGYFCYVPVETAREKGWLPPKDSRFRPTRQVECPICGKNGSLSVGPSTNRYTKKSGEVMIYRSIRVRVVHPGNDRCNIPLPLAQEQGWIDGAD